MSATRTLVVHLGGIGNFLLTCPALIRLAEDGPVELLGRPDRLALAVAAGIAQATHDVDSAGFETVFTEPNDRLGALLTRFDRCIVWMRDAQAAVRGIRCCGVADVRAFPGLPPADWPDHATQYYQACLGYDAAPALRLAVAPVETAHDVVIHPGSGGRSKNWPLDRFAALAGALGNLGRSVAWCLGPAEEALAPPPQATVLRRASLVDLARELAAARDFVGNDCGVAHLAAAVGCATVAVFGPTDPAVWAPLGDHVTVVRGAPWPSAAAVLAHVSAGAGTP